MKKRHYFDYAASTPVDPAVVKAMAPFWSEQFGNPGSLHSFGQEASAAVFKARDTIAKSLGCHYSEIIFTGSATEANNLAIRGVIKGIRNKELGIRESESRISNKESGKNSNSVIHNSSFTIPKIIVSAIEHDSILETARDLSRLWRDPAFCNLESVAGEKDGVEVVYLPVDKNGIVDLEKLKSELDERTILVSIMYANNEIGTIQPIAEIAKIIRNFRNSKHEALNTKQSSKSKIQNVSDFDIRISDFGTAYPLFHCDAVQAFNYLPCDVNELGVDLLTLSAQKIYGPKGVGALYIKNSKHEARNTKQIQNSKFKTNKVSDFGFRISNLQLVSPIVTGGQSQEYGLRGGTENVPGIVGFGRAVELISNSRELENKRLKKLQEYFLARMKKIAPKAKLNGDFKNRLPNNINLYIPPKVSGTAQDLIIKLDLAGFAVSPGSACSARVCSPSHVLKALGYSDERATNSIRITFGRQTNKNEVDKLLKEIYHIL